MISGHAQLDAFRRDDAERRLIKGIDCPACAKATAAILLIIVFAPLIVVGVCLWVFR